MNFNGGQATISYTGLPSWYYRFQFMASYHYPWLSPSRLLVLVVLSPWWRTRLAYVIYFLLLLSIVLLAFYLYQKQTRERLERKYKEEILLLRIKNLIEQCNLLETERESRQEKGEVIQNQSNEEESDKSLNAEESAFMARAIAMVEQNLGESGYSVEQLSRDLCMDRTGLYRKLMAVMDQTPTLFIRSIRLQKAAQLIREGELSITEISDRLGFSTPSYMSRCFQDVYGCRPSEYAKRHE